ncbi:MAG: ATP12 family protein [Pseudomonadota bacterium]
MKRFYDAVDIRAAEDNVGWQITLDGRGLKTVRGTPQLLPSKSLAEAMAREWSEQSENLDTTRFVFRDMADYAIDVVSGARDETVAKLIAYAETDTLCYRADPEDALFARQQEVWEPLLGQLEAQDGVSFTRVSGIVHKPQSAETLTALRQRIEGESPFALAALESMAALSASLSIAILASAPDADAESLWRAACLEEEWQADLWGRDYEAEERRAKRRGDFLAAQDFLELSRG